MRTDAQSRVAALLARSLPQEIAEDLIGDFVALRGELSRPPNTGSRMGHFVESVVQSLQFLETGQYESKPSVDAFLRGVESRKSLDDGLRLCVSRAARAIYAIRSLRDVAHKGSLKANEPDRLFAFATAQWILTELVRQVAATSIEDADQLIRWIQTPINPLIEEIDGQSFVLADAGVRDEVALLLGNRHPDPITRAEVIVALPLRSDSAIDQALKKLIEDRMAVRLNPGVYALTSVGVAHVDALAQRLAGDRIERQVS